VARTFWRLPGLSARVELVTALGAGNADVAVVAWDANSLVTVGTAEEAVLPPLREAVP